MPEYLFDDKVLQEIDLKLCNLTCQDINFPEVGPNLILRPLSSDDFQKGKQLTKTVSGLLTSN